MGLMLWATRCRLFSLAYVIARVDPSKRIGLMPRVPPVIFDTPDDRFLLRFWPLSLSRF